MVFPFSMSSGVIGLRFQFPSPSISFSYFRRNYNLKVLIIKSLLNLKSFPFLHRLYLIYSHKIFCNFVLFCRAKLITLKAANLVNHSMAAVFHLVSACCCWIFIISKLNDLQSAWRGRRSWRWSIEPSNQSIKFSSSTNSSITIPRTSPGPWHPLL